MPVSRNPHCFIKITLPQSRRHQANVDGWVIKFSAQEHRFLETLLLRYPRYTTAEQLIEMIWGHCPDGGPEWAEASVTQHIWKLRRKLGRDRILTDLPLGYLLNPGVGGPLVPTPPADQRL